MCVSMCLCVRPARCVDTGGSLGVFLLVHRVSGGLSTRKTKCGSLCVYVLELCVCVFGRWPWV